MGRGATVFLCVILLGASGFLLSGQTGAVLSTPAPGYRDGIWHYQQEVYSRPQAGSQNDGLQRAEAWVLFDEQGQVIKSKGFTWRSPGDLVATARYDGKIVTVVDHFTDRELQFTPERHPGQPPLFPEWFAQAHSKGEVRFLREVGYLGKPAILSETTSPVDRMITDDWAGPYVKDLHPRLIRRRFTVEPHTLAPLAVEWIAVDDRGQETVVYYERKTLNEFLPATAENLKVLDR